MKIIDKTPLQDDKGEISLVSRLQGTLKYGFDWYAEMEAQKIVLNQLNSALEKGFILIRNFNLPGSPIFIPLILIGAGGIYVIHPTSAKGHFEAKGDQWNVIDNSGNSQPARVNLLDKAIKLTRAFQKYLDINKIKVTAPIETVVVAVNPGAHIETVRPAVKVVKSDVIKTFIASLSQAVPVWRTDFIYELADRIVEPHLHQPQPEPPAPEPVNSFVSFEDSSSATSFDARDFATTFQEEPAEQAPRASTAPPQPTARPRPAQPASKKIFGMTRTQFFVIAGIFVFWLCIMAGLGALILFRP